MFDPTPCPLAAALRRLQHAHDALSAAARSGPPLASPGLVYALLEAAENLLGVIRAQMAAPTVLRLLSVNGVRYTLRREALPEGFLS